MSQRLESNDVESNDVDELRCRNFGPIDELHWNKQKRPWARLVFLIFITPNVDHEFLFCWTLYGQHCWQSTACPDCAWAGEAALPLSQSILLKLVARSEKRISLRLINIQTLKYKVGIPSRSSHPGQCEAKSDAASEQDATSGMPHLRCRKRVGAS